ncbi:exosortase family protein XrtF [Frigoriflavimonas asaccharolytica]|uniref:Exosortase family protein XrtF n=1 Tax=Frigoriflavimonas asaccharolytica TaxID=2735899 RepID=A0A8J8GAP9_9FLAO|nr:exosortase family protein XrtF [Frigoriflavimonas asaccharolytica]NRS92167.1 exosortase family protein XrtF [Frigoriflavimonas asaccharolytica]
MFSDFKPILLVLLRFIVIYLALLFAYQMYLHPFEGVDMDPFSYWVAHQVVYVQNFLGYSTSLFPYPIYETAVFQTEGVEVTRMVEGCNIVSVLILFVAFIFAFYKGWKTFLFAIICVAILHFANVLRIVGLNLVMLKYPDYGKFTHDYLFPAAIYGMVVVLWLVWIKFFALKNEAA